MASRDLVIIMVDSVAFNDSMVSCFTVDSKPLMDESTAVDCMVGDPVITGEAFVNRPASLTGLLIVAEGTIAEGATEGVIECSMVGGDKEITTALVINIVGEVPAYSVVSRDGIIEGTGAIVSLDFKVSEDDLDGVREFVIIMIAVLVSTAMGWDSVLFVVLIPTDEKNMVVDS